MRTILRQHLKNIRIIFSLAWVDLIKQYRGASLSWLWAIIRPSMIILTFWFTFTYGFRVGGDVGGNPYWLWLVAGIIPWFLIRNMLGSGPTSIRKYSYLVSKMKFPISIIPTFVTLSKFIEHLILMAIVFVLFILFGTGLGIYTVQILFYLMLMYILFNAWALLSSLLGVISRDFTNLVKSTITPLFWISGILFDPATVSNSTLNTFLQLNPITYLTQGYRNALINDVWFWENMPAFYFFISITLIIIILAITLYSRLHKVIVDEL